MLNAEVEEGIDAWFGAELLILKFNESKNNSVTQRQTHLTLRLKPAAIFHELHYLRIHWHEIRATFSCHDDGAAGITHPYTFI